MAENLKVSHYGNGDEILNIQDNSTWSNIGIGAWCYFRNDQNIGKEYNKLYNWYAVSDSRNVCPSGWRMPTKYDFEMLVYNLGGILSSAKMLMESGEKYWKTNLGSNLSGFSARAGSWRGGDGIFYYWVRDLGNWWSISKENNKTNPVDNYPWFLTIDGNKAEITRNPYYSPNAGVSVRCIKN